eukprot:scaffold195170_cov24-Tisochrysis_lutea.AAC.3
MSAYSRHRSYHRTAQGERAAEQRERLGEKIWRRHVGVDKHGQYGNRCGGDRRSICGVGVMSFGWHEAAHTCSLADVAHVTRRCDDGATCRMASADAAYAAHASWF